MDVRPAGADCPAVRVIGFSPHKNAGTVNDVFHLDELGERIILLKAAYLSILADIYDFHQSGAVRRNPVSGGLNPRDFRSYAAFEYPLNIGAVIGQRDIAVNLLLNPALIGYFVHSDGLCKYFIIHSIPLLCGFTMVL